MVVNVSKKNYIIFLSKGKKGSLTGGWVIFDSNENNVQQPDPNSVYELERIHDIHVDEKMHSFKLLGVCMMKHMTLSKQADHGCAN